MTPTARRSLAMLTASAILVLMSALTSCSGGGSASDPAGPPVDASALDTPGRDDATTEGYDEFADPALTTYPERGAKFGDGSTLDFVYGDNDETRYPTYGYQLAYIQGDGAVIPLGGNNFYDVVDGAFSTSDPVFDSTADQRYGFMSVTVTQDPSIDDTNTIDAKTTELGVFCLFFVQGE